MADKNIQDQFFFLHKKIDGMVDCLNAIKEAVICEDCEIECSFTMSGFDYESGGFWGSGAFQASVNGVATSTPWAFAGTENKSEGYQGMIDQINATAGWSVTVVNDVSMSTTGLVDWQFDYCGPAEGSTLTIVRGSGTNNDTVNLDAQSGEGSFTNVGFVNVNNPNGEISNDRQPVKL